MVTSLLGRLLVLTILLSVTTSGCFFQWGEAPPPPKVVVMPSGGGSCPEFDTVLKGDDAASLRTLDCWAREGDQIWTQVRGRTPDVLTLPELKTLLRKRAVPVEGDLSEHMRRIDAVNSLLGLEGSLSRKRFRDFVGWIRRNRQDLRTIHRKLTRDDIQFDHAEDILPLVRVLKNYLLFVQWGPNVDLESLLGHLRVATGIKDDQVTRLRAIGLLLGLDRRDQPLQMQAIQRVQWLERHWKGLTILFRRIRDRNEAVSYGNLLWAARAVDGLLRQVEWKLAPEDLKNQALIALDIQDDEIRRAAGPAVAVMDGALRLACPTLKTRGLWAAVEIGSCLTRLTDHYNGYAQYFVEFLINRGKRVPTDNELRTIRKSLVAFRGATAKWFSQPGLRPMPSRPWLELSRTMGALPPDDFIHSLRLVTYFDSKSNQDWIHPRFIARVADGLIRFQWHLLDGFPTYVRVTKQKQCANPDASYWTRCQLRPDRKISESSSTLRLMFKVKNPNFGLEAAPYDGHRYGKIMLFYAFSKDLMGVFDKDGDGFVSTRGVGDDNEIFRFLAVTMQSVHIIQGFVDNFKRKLEGMPIEPVEPPSSGIRRMDYEAFAKLVAIAGGEILVKRGPKDRKYFEDIREGWLDIFPESSVHLDRLALTALLNFMDELSDYNRSYLLDVGVKDPDAFDDRVSSKQWLRRSAVFKALSRIMLRHFPRTYWSCVDYGYDRACQIATEELFPNRDDEKPGYVHYSDLKLVTLLGAAIEGAFDNCNENGDRYLSDEYSFGRDELDCAYTRVADVATRIIDSKLIKDPSPGVKRLAKLVDFLDAFSVTRTFGKVALARGSASSLYLNPVRSAVSRQHATLGSLYALLSELMDSERADRTPRRKKGH